MTIEAEIRSFVSEAKYKELIEFFEKNAKDLGVDHQETYYFDSDTDLRIQKNDFFSKIWLKKGQLHDEAREELEIKFDRNDFDKLGGLFKLIGLNVKIKWLRLRRTFDWGGVSVMLDYTKGYGYILELEKLIEPKEKNETLLLLKEKLASLGIKQTEKGEFDHKYAYYKEHWKELLQ